MTSRKEIHFSEWLESMHKDVECTFGILKGRWRILKTGIRIHGLTEAVRIWKTYCAFHNWLLETDGLDKKWEEEIPSWWKGQAGKHDPEEAAQIWAIGWLCNPSKVRLHNTTGMGPGDNCDGGEVSGDDEVFGEDDEEEVPQLPVGHCDIQSVRSMTMRAFRLK